jgi:hypothetical protein
MDGIMVERKARMMRRVGISCSNVFLCLCIYYLRPSIASIGCYDQYEFDLEFWLLPHITFVPAFLLGYSHSA